jgi:hypothetical protein
MRRVLAIVVSLLFGATLLATPPMTGRVFAGESSPKLTFLESILPQDGKALVAWRRARALESEGLVDDAFTAYATALEAKSKGLADSSLNALRRLEGKREQLGPIYGLDASTAVVSNSLRVPLFFALVLFVVAFVLTLVLPRRGSQLGDLPVPGALRPATASEFQASLLGFTNTVRRVFGSEFARRLGITLSFDARERPIVAGADIFDRALAEASMLEAKGIVRFAVTGVVHWIAQSILRPSILITGAVQLLPGGARATARVRDLRSGTETEVDARSHELDGLIRNVSAIKELLGHSHSPVTASS